jgi:hypothetical protein
LALRRRVAKEVLGEQGVIEGDVRPQAQPHALQRNQQAVDVTLVGGDNQLCKVVPLALRQLLGQPKVQQHRRAAVLPV